jgi:hypothetical protein
VENKKREVMRMKSQGGLWIDHAKAVLVVPVSRGEKVHVIYSGVEKQGGRSEGLRSTEPFEALQVPADDSRQRRLTGQLNGYYEAVATALRQTEEVLIFGPGEAKLELKKRLEKDGLGGRVAAVETTDYLTDHQIIAKVREFFQLNRGISAKRLAAGPSLKNVKDLVGAKGWKDTEVVRGHS